MKNNLSLLLLLSLLYFNYSCNKEDMNPHGLPSATESGENTFGCLINGEPWIAEIGLGVFDPSIHKIVSYYDEVGVGVSDIYYFSMSAKYVNIEDSIFDIFSFNFLPVYEAGTFDFSTLSVKDITLSRGQPGMTTNLKIYELDTLYNNYFNLTKLDFENNICSGKFNVRLIDNQNLDTLDITQGRFDVKYQPE